MDRDDVLCPECWSRVPVTAAPAHVSTEGPVRYLRCACGRWLIVVAGEVIGTAGDPAASRRRGRASKSSRAGAVDR